jgi:spoIIIJ-associated protein
MSTGTDESTTDLPAEGVEQSTDATSGDEALTTDPRPDAGDPAEGGSTGETSLAAAGSDEDSADREPRADGAGSEKKPTRREALEAEGDVAADFLEALLDIADIVGDIDVDIDGDRAAVSIVDSEEGRVPRRLVGPDGKVLEALQELTRLAVQTETGERSRLMLDVAGHRATRRTEVVEIAGGAIAKVRESGIPVEMDPMSAFERKIVHDEVLAAGLRSESEGVEPHRYVIVLPAS